MAGRAERPGVGDLTVARRSALAPRSVTPNCIVLPVEQSGVPGPDWIRRPDGSPRTRRTWRSTADDHMIHSTRGLRNSVGQPDHSASGDHDRQITGPAIMSTSITTSYQRRDRPNRFTVRVMPITVGLGCPVAMTPGRCTDESSRRRWSRCAVVLCSTGQLKLLL